MAILNLWLHPSIYRLQEIDLLLEQLNRADSEEEWREKLQKLISISILRAEMEREETKSEEAECVHVLLS